MRLTPLKQKALLGTAILALCSFSFSIPSRAQTDVPVLKTAQTELINIKGEKLGTVSLSQGKNGVTIRLQAEKLPTGAHSFHIHETAACTPDSEFKSAGGHLNPDNKAHGFNAESGPHAGDLPNIFVTETGAVTAEVYNDRISLEDRDGKINLLDADGASIMIHENPDDYVSQPTGGGGARIACAEIKAE